MKFQSPEQMDRENQELDALEQADADTSQNADSGPQFKPVIPLPDLVEVRTSCRIFTFHNLLPFCTVEIIYFCGLL